MAKTINLGKVGVTLGGDYDSSKNYASRTCVFYNHVSWTSKKDVPAGIAPGTNDEYWQKVSERGAQGIQGERGPQGNSAFDGTGIELVNNLTQGGEASALSAEQGKILKTQLTELESKVFKTSSNRFAPKAIKSNTYANTQGVEIASANLSVTDFISVESGESINWAGQGSSGFVSFDARFLTAYDSNKNAIEISGAEFKAPIYVVPQGVSYIRISISSSYLSSLSNIYVGVLSNRELNAGYYEPYEVDELNPALLGDLNRTLDFLRSESLRLEMEIGANLLDGDNFKNKSFINANGDFGDTSIALASTYKDLIEVKEGEIWHYNGGWDNQPSLGFVWGYDSKEPTTKINLVPCDIVVNKDFIIPLGINYLAVWVYDKGELYKTDSLTNRVSTLESNAFEKVIVSDNLLNPNKVVDGYYVNYKNGNLVTLAEFSTSEPIMIEAGVNYVQNYSQQIAFYDENNKYLSGENVTKGIPYTAPSNAKYLRICFPTSIKYTICVNKGNEIVGDSFKEGFKDFFIPNGNILQKETTVIASRNDKNYNSIRDLMQSLPASASQRYVIYVPKGRWFECDILGSPYIRIIGEDKDETILYCDGNAEVTTPSDYSFANYANTRLVDVPKEYKHCINIKNDIYCENITIECTNGKYCVHIDSEGKRTCDFKHCKFVAKEDVNFPLGFGIWANQNFTFENCEIYQYESKRYSVYIHNWNNQKASCSVDFRYCYFNKSYASIWELGSEYSTFVNFLNCISGVAEPCIYVGVEKRANGNSFWIDANGNNVSDFSLVPYSLKINYIGTKVHGIEQSDRDRILNYLIGENKTLL